MSKFWTTCDKRRICSSLGHGAQLNAMVSKLPAATHDARSTCDVAPEQQAGTATCYPSRRNALALQMFGVGASCFALQSMGVAAAQIDEDVAMKASCLVSQPPAVRFVGGLALIRAPAVCANQRPTCDPGKYRD
jgi:hypothetical protein